LRVVGDGVTSRYQDNEAGQITLHSRESLAAVAVAVGDAGLSELRFRSNIAIEGVEAWGEQSWVGRKIRIGKLIFDVVIPKADVSLPMRTLSPVNGICLSSKH